MACLVPLFSQTANKNISNTIVETSLVGTGIGSKTIQANYLTVGKRIRIRVYGFFSRMNGNITIRFKIGTIVISATATASSGTGTNAGFKIELDCVVRAIGVAGQVIAQGNYTNLNTGTNLEMTNTTTDIIDTTIANIIDVTLQFSTANVNNTFTSTNSEIEFYN